ncbi:hypothetical protein MTO96_034683 [Rhipicephalus appendiculatus]
MEVGSRDLYAADGYHVSRGQGIKALSRALSLAVRAAFRGKWQPCGGRPRDHRRPGPPGPAAWTRNAWYTEAAPCRFGGPGSTRAFPEEVFAFYDAAPSTISEASGTTRGRFPGAAMCTTPSARICIFDLGL